MKLRTFSFLALAAFLAVTPALVQADAKSALTKYALAMGGVHSYHADIQTDKETIGMDMALPGRYHMTIPSAGMEVISIDPDLWIKNSGHWMKLPMHVPQMDAMISRARGSSPPADIDKTYTITDLGMKDGLHAYRMQRTGSSGVTTLYLRPDSLPGKMVVTEDGKTTTITYSNYNNVTVTAP